jgi:hypothetical protein
MTFTGSEIVAAAKRVQRSTNTPPQVKEAPYWKRATPLLARRIPTKHLGTLHYCLAYGLAVLERGTFREAFAAADQRWASLMHIYCTSGLNLSDFADHYGVKRTTIQERLLQLKPTMTPTNQDFYERILREVEASPPPWQGIAPPQPTVPEERLASDDSLEAIEEALLTLLGAGRGLIKQLFMLLRSEGHATVRQRLLELLSRDKGNVLFELENLLNAVNSPDGKAFKEVFELEKRR